jgi:hypothetical protein
MLRIGYNIYTYTCIKEMLLSSIQIFNDYAASFEGQELSSKNNIKMYILVNGSVKLGREYQRWVSC